MAKRKKYDTSVRIQDKGIDPLKGLNFGDGKTQMSQEAFQALDNVRSGRWKDRSLGMFGSSGVNIDNSITSGPRSGVKLGESKYDDAIFTLASLDRYENERGQRQSAWAQWGAGIGKFVITGLSTIFEGLPGLAVGLAKGNYNVATGKGPGGFVEGFWNNPIFDFFEGIREDSEKWLPSYETDAYNESPWYTHFGNANFWANSLVKNAGFAVGAFVGGGLEAKALGALFKGAAGLYRATKGVKGLTGTIEEARNVKRGIDTIKNAEKALKESEELLQTSGKVGEAAAKSYQEINEANRLLEGSKNWLGNAITQAKNNKLGSTLGSNFLSAITEGSEEAYQAHKEFKDEATASLEQQHLQKQQELLEQYGEGPELAAALAKEEEAYQKGLARIEEDAKKIGNTTLALNVPLLTLSNLLQFGKLVSGGSANIIYKAANINRRNLHKGFLPRITGKKAGELAVKWKKTRIAAHAIKDPVTEGLEEMSQAFISEYAKLPWDGDPLGYYKAAQKDEEGTFTNYMNESARLLGAFQKSFGDINRWEEGFIGALTGAIGMPKMRSFRTKVKNEEGGESTKWQIPIKGWGGGVWGAIQDEREKLSRAQYLVDTVNGYMNDKSGFKERVQALVRNTNIGKLKEDAADRQDIFNVKSAEFAELINMIQMFDATGTLEDLRSEMKEALKNENVNNISDEEIDQLIEATTQPSVGEEVAALYEDLKTQYKSTARKFQEAKLHEDALEEIRQQKQDLETQLEEQIADVQRRAPNKGMASIWSNRLRAQHAAQLDQLTQKEQAHIEALDNEGDSVTHQANMSALESQINKIEGAKGVTYTGPFVKSNGEKLSYDEVRERIKKNIENIDTAIDYFKEVKDNIERNSSAAFSDEVLGHLTFLGAQIKNWESREAELAEKLATQNERNPRLQVLYDKMRTQMEVRAKQFVEIPKEENQTEEEHKAAIEENASMLIHKLAEDPETSLEEETQKIKDDKSLTEEKKEEKISNLRSLLELIRLTDKTALANRTALSVAREDELLRVRKSKTSNSVVSPGPYTDEINYERTKKEDAYDSTWALEARDLHNALSVLDSEVREGRMDIGEAREIYRDTYDLFKLRRAKEDFRDIWNKAIVNPEAFQSMLDLTKKNFEKALNEENSKPFYDRLKEATTLSQYREIMNGELDDDDDVKARDDAHQKLKNEGNGIAKEFDRMVEFSKSILAKIPEVVRTTWGGSNQETRAQIEADAITLWRKHAEAAESLEDLKNADSPRIMDPQVFDEEPEVPIMSKESRFYTAAHAVRKALDNKQGWEDWMSTWKSPQPSSSNNNPSGPTNTPSGNNPSSESTSTPNEESGADDSEDDGSSGSSSTGNTPGVDFPVGNDSVDDLDGASDVITKEASKKEEAVNNNRATNTYIRPAIPEINPEDKRIGNLTRTFKETNPSFATIWDYLNENGAFEYVNNGSLQEGDEVHFAVIEDYENKDDVKNATWNKDGKGNSIPTIFLVVNTSEDANNPQWQIVGSLSGTERNTSKYVGFKKLIEDIHAEYSQAKSSGNAGPVWTFSETTKVSQTIPGFLQFSSNNPAKVNNSPEDKQRSIANVDGMDQGIPPIAIYKGNGEWILPQGRGVKPSDISQAVTAAANPGSMVALVPSGDSYIPAFLRVAHCNKNEFDLTQKSVQNTPIGKKLMEIFLKLVEVADTEGKVNFAALKNVVGELKKVLYIGDIEVDTNQEENAVVFKKNGTYVGQLNFSKSETTASAASPLIKVVNYVRRSAEEIIFGDPNDAKSRGLISILNSLSLPFQVEYDNAGNISNVDDLAESGCLKTTLESTNPKGGWFIMDYRDDDGAWHEGDFPQGAVARAVTGGVTNTPSSTRTSVPSGGNSGGGSAAVSVPQPDTNPLGGNNTAGGGIPVSIATGNGRRTLWVRLGNDVSDTEIKVTDNGSWTRIDTTKPLQAYAYELAFFEANKDAIKKSPGNYWTAPVNGVMHEYFYHSITMVKGTALDVTAGKIVKATRPANTLPGATKVQIADAAMDRVLEAQQRVNGRTSTYYTIGGQRYQRLHSWMNDHRSSLNPYHDREDKQAKEAADKQIAKLKQYKSKQGRVNFLKKLEKDFNIDLSSYLDLTQELSSGFTDNTLESIRKDIEGAFISNNPYAAAGTAIDSVVRLFFSPEFYSGVGSEIDIEKFKEQIRNNTKLGISGPVLDSLCQALISLKKEFDSRGERVYTNKIVLYGEFNGQKVAGEVDIITKDSNGDFRIYDIKTSKQPINSAKRGSRNPHPMINFYGVQVRAYAEMFHQMTGLPVAGVYLSNTQVTIGEKSGEGVFSGRSVYDHVNSVQAFDTFEVFPGVIQEWNPQGGAIVRPAKPINTPAPAPTPAPSSTPAPTNITPSPAPAVTTAPVSNSVTPAPTSTPSPSSAPTNTPAPSTPPSVPASTPSTSTSADPFGIGREAVVTRKNTKQRVIVYPGFDLPNGKPCYFLLDNVTPGKTPGVYRATIKIALTNGRVIPLPNNVVQDGMLKVEGGVLTVDSSIGGKRTPLSDFIYDSIELQVPKFFDAIVEHSEYPGDPIFPEDGGSTSPADSSSSTPSNPTGTDSGIRTIKSIGKRTLSFRAKDRIHRRVWNKDREMEWINKVLPQLSREGRVKVVKNLSEIIEGGSEAWGAFRDGILYIAENAAMGTLYHESFHSVFQTMLSENRKEELFKEASRKWKTDNKEVLEEKMAEEFRKYTQRRKDNRSPDRSLGRKILDFFEELWYKITHWKELEPHLLSLCKEINEGKFAKLAQETSSGVYNEHSKEALKSTIDLEAKPKSTKEESKESKERKEERKKPTRSKELEDRIKRRAASYKFKSDWESLAPKIRENLKNKGMSPEEFNNMDSEMQEYFRNCSGI